MKKIPSIFVRDWNGDRSRVTSQQNPECAWVFAGEGIATRKFDGTCVMIKGGEFFCRYDAKGGKQPPVNFIPAQAEADSETGHWPGWVPATMPQHKWQIMAFVKSPALPDGTYEACGPHFQANPERYTEDRLIAHGVDVLDAPRTYSELVTWFADKDIEGIVWHHPDGRMAKIKKGDFGLKR